MSATCVSAASTLPVGRPKLSGCIVIAAIAAVVGLALPNSAAVWVAVMAAVAVGSLFWNVKSALLAVIVCSGLLAATPFDGGMLSRLYAGDVAIGMFLLGWCFRSQTSARVPRFPDEPIIKPLRWLAVVACLSMLWSRVFPEPGVLYTFPNFDVPLIVTQLTQLFLLATVVCMPFAVVAMVRDRSDIENVVLTAGVVMAIGSVLTILALIFDFGGTEMILGFRRAYWEQSWHLSAQHLLVAVLPFLYAAVLFASRAMPAYRIFVSLLVFCFIGVVLSFSRECWTASALEIGLLTAYRLRHHLRSVTLAAGVSVALLWPLLPSLFAPLSQFYNPDAVYGFERIVYYRTAIELFLSHPFLGVGMGNFQFFDRFMDQTGGGIAHNQLLTLAAETGIFGGCIFIWFAILLLRMSRRFYRSAIDSDDPDRWVLLAGSALLVAWPVESLFGEVFFPSAAHGGGTLTLMGVTFNWIFLGLLFAADMFTNRNDLEPAAEQAHPKKLR